MGLIGFAMRLLFLSHYFKPEGNAPASRTYEHCKRWVAAGHEVTVITSCPNVPHGRPYAGYRNRLVQEEWMDGIRVIRVWTFLAANKGTVRRTLNYLSYFVSANVRAIGLRGIDVIVATSPQFFCGLAGSVVSMLQRKPFVLEIRDIWPESIEAVGALGARSGMAMLAWMERWMYRSARHIVCVGNGYRGKLLERGVAEESISVITNGADLSVYGPGEGCEVLRERFGLRGKFVVAYVGTLGMACGLEVVMDAAAAMVCDDVVFLLVGDGARRGELEEMAKERGLDQVMFTGQVEKGEIPALLRTVDVCLVHLRGLPLFRTVLPSKIFEAFATGKPIIVGVPEMRVLSFWRLRLGLRLLRKMLKRWWRRCRSFAMTLNVRGSWELMAGGWWNRITIGMFWPSGFLK